MTNFGETGSEVSYFINEKEKFDGDLISTKTLHDIRDGNQTHPKIDKREARLAIREYIKQKKLQ